MKRKDYLHEEAERENKTASKENVLRSVDDLLTNVESFLDQNNVSINFNDVLIEKATIFNDQLKSTLPHVRKIASSEKLNILLEISDRIKEIDIDALRYLLRKDDGNDDKVDIIWQSDWNGFVQQMEETKHHLQNIRTIIDNPSIDSLITP